MTRRGETRRDFIKAASALVSGCMASTALPDAPTAAKVLNYSPGMNYRRLGKTEFMISEIALGGHGAGGYDERAVRNRIAVLERAVELGMNYVDTNIGRECDVYGEAMARSANAKRDKWFIGFASSEDHYVPGLEDQLTAAKLMTSIEERLRSYKTDMLDMWRPVAATWAQIEPSVDRRLAVTRRMFDLVAEVFDKARQQGKVRFLGTSEHEPKVFRQALEEFPQFQVIIFPCFFLDKASVADELLELARKKDVGAIGMKAFGAGSVFGPKSRQRGPGKPSVDPRGHVLLKKMLAEKRISAIIPGVGVPEHLEENVKASQAREGPKAEQEGRAIRQCRASFDANLAPEYAWLRRWGAV
jgi:aryl-alcohol dehydrogenase-like predicted oxidoreductase